VRGQQQQSPGNVDGRLDAVAVPTDGLLWSAGPDAALCLSDGNCTQIATGSTSVLEVDALLEVLDAAPWTGGKNNAGGNCTAQIVSAHTDQTQILASLLCNCPIRCPAVAAPISSELDNNSNLSSSADLLPVEQQKELDRLKHNRGFWLYFILRIIASGSLATSFSMFVSFLGFHPQLIFKT
jgi:hypothetical protein